MTGLSSALPGVAGGKKKPGKRLEETLRDGMRGPNATATRERWRWRWERGRGWRWGEMLKRRKWGIEEGANSDEEEEDVQ